MGAITQMTDFDNLSFDSDDSDDDWAGESHVDCSPVASPRASSSTDVPALGDVAVASPRASPRDSPRDEASARGEASAAEFENAFGVCAPDPLTVQDAVWTTMVRTNLKMETDTAAFKAVVKAGLESGMESNPMVDPMIDGMMYDLLKVDKIDINSLFQIVGEIPDYIRTGIETGDFPSTSTEELIAQVQNLSDLLQKLCEACTAAFLQVPPDDYKQSASECIKECLRMLKLLSGFRVHDGMSWQSEELITFVSFVTTISKRNINVLPRMPLPQPSEFLKLALVEYLKGDLFKKLGTEVASLTKWADGKIKKVQADAKKAEKAAEKAEKAAEKEKAVEAVVKRQRVSPPDVIAIPSPEPEAVEAVNALDGL